MRDKNLNNFELIARNVHVISLQEVIEKANYESSQKCDKDRQLKTISFYLENREGIYNIFDVYRKHEFGKPIPRQ